MIESLSARIKALLQAPQHGSELPSPGEEATGAISRFRVLEKPLVGDGCVAPLRGDVSSTLTPSDRATALERESELVALLECGTPDQIVHAVRNLQNNVVLLKALLAKQDGQRLC